MSEETKGRKRRRSANGANGGQLRTGADLAEATGAADLRERAIAQQNTKTVERYKNAVPGEPDIIEGETPDEMRARVRQERAESQPTEYMLSILPGRDDREREIVEE
jgi:hypothetical protein